MARAVTGRTSAVIVCTPNNPTGTAARRDELVDFLDRVPSDVLVVLDEAYREFVSDDDVPDGLDLLRRHDNLAVLRTFSKTYGMAGLRLGVCLANPAVSDALRKCLPPFAVSHVSQQVALAALEPDVERELLRRVGLVVAERARLEKALRERVMDLPESHGNSVWLPVGEHAAAFAKACEGHGVIIRPFPGDGVRITIGTAADNDKVVEVCDRVAADLGIRERS